MTSQAITTEATRVWRQIRELVDAPSRAHVSALIERDATRLADLFYHQMLADPDAALLLDHELVNTRLRASMTNWLRKLFDDATDIDELITIQRRTGDVHARIGVSGTAVASGARVLKRAISEQLIAEPLTGAQAGAVQYTYELIDIAIGTMQASANTSAARIVRSDESYRLFFLTQNLRAERERQKSRLLEWAHQILVRNYWELSDDGVSDGGTPPQNSQFELWVEHKASMLFNDSPELALIRDCIRHIDRDLMPQLKQAGTDRANAKDIVTLLNRQVDRIKNLLATMFDHATEMEDGRDAVTHLLNRRFFPSIVKREIGLAQAGGRPFALLLMEIDRFDDIGHALGADLVDQVLAQVANTLSENTRAGDFVFRYGDSQFLVLLVEAGHDVATSIGESLRDQVARLNLRTPAGLAPRLTVSIGIAGFDGHPDYQRLLEQAETGLRNARSAGGGQVRLVKDF